MRPLSIIIVENNIDIRNTLRHAFETRGYLTWTCPAPEIAKSLFPAVQPTVVLLDVDFDDLSMVSLLDTCKEQAPGAKVIVESRNADAGRRQEALDHGAEAFLVKPFSLEPLFEILEKNTPPPKKEAA